MSVGAFQEIYGFLKHHFFVCCVLCKKKYVSFQNDQTMLAVRVVYYRLDKHVYAPESYVIWASHSVFICSSKYRF